MVNIWKFKEKWFSFEEINEIVESEKDIEKWNILTKKDMDNFVKNELFSNFKNKVHV